MERARDAIDEILERLPLNFELDELEARGEDKVIIPAVTTAKTSHPSSSAAVSAAALASSGAAHGDLEGDFVREQHDDDGASDGGDSGSLADDHHDDGSLGAPAVRRRGEYANAEDDIDDAYPGAHGGSEDRDRGGGVDDDGDGLPATARDPFFTVFFNECSRMNALLTTVRGSLEHADLALRGAAALDGATLEVLTALEDDRVPAAWRRAAYPSELPLSAWFADLVARAQQLQEWTVDLTMPGSVRVSALFNPPALLTALRQRHALLTGLELEKLAIVTEPTRLAPGDCPAQPEESASLQVHGLYIEGATYDASAGHLAPARFKARFTPLPVLRVRAVARVIPAQDHYECPVYATEARGGTFVFAIRVPSGGVSPARWVREGVACVLGPVSGDTPGIDGVE
jgi:hypothetical protein